MQATRVVKFGTTTGASGQVYSNATTWKQLVAGDSAFEAMSMTPGMAATIKVPGGGATYKVESQDQNLPEGDFNVYFTPDKNNSGTIEELEAALEIWASNVEGQLPF